MTAGYLYVAVFLQGDPREATCAASHQGGQGEVIRTRGPGEATRAVSFQGDKGEIILIDGRATTATSLHQRWDVKAPV